MMVERVTLYKKLIFIKSYEKEAGINFVLLCKSRNVVGEFKKLYLHRPINILHFLTPARIQKC